MKDDDRLARLPQVPGFELTSTTVRAGEPLPVAQWSGIFGQDGGLDASPHLRWHGAPASTQSFAVTMYDLDAPTSSGFWHWAVADIPASVTELLEGAGDAGGTGLPAPAFQLPNDARMPRFLGAAPPAGHGTHRYVITVTALDIDRVDITPDSTPAALGFAMAGHTVGRAMITATAESIAG